MNIEETENSSSETVQVIFKTKLPPKYQVPETPIDLPLNLSRFGLSEIITHLLGLEETKIFEFLLQNEFLRSSLGEMLLKLELTGEKIIELEYTNSLSAPEPLGQYNHDDWVSSVHCIKRKMRNTKNSKEANFFVTGCYDSFVRIWDIADQATPKIVIKGHSNAVKSVKWAKKDCNEYVLSGGMDQRIILWKIDHKLKMYSLVKEFQGHVSSIESISVSPNEKYFSSSSYDGSVLIWDLDSVIAKEKEKEIEKETEITKEDNEKKTKRKRVLNKFETESTILPPRGQLKGHKQKVTCLKWKEQEFIYTSSTDHCLRKFDIEKGIAVWEQRTPNSILSFELGENSKKNYIISAHTDSAIRIWDERVSSKEQENDGLSRLSSIKAHKNWVPSISWRPKSQYHFASCGYDNSVKIWDFRSQTPSTMITKNKHTDKVLMIDWNDSNTLLSASADKKVKINKII
ncbi:ribosome biogenesis protein wdr12 [Anaeramoeba flamelloides]|uniref:Ribosome biogenesis protein WDR12 homolog n=1 Tax=Anaeramoeba flamelloides TaxID=1746091 RepID=A0AAV7Z9P1_9EUKA|nr:ribosome biogenesis protein wdr12 [Anaeramoeba flamelloides]